MSDALERVGFSVDWSNPLAGAIDETIRAAIKQLGLDEYLEKVSGDNERLLEVAREWRAAARDMQGVVEDLRAERKTLEASWTGEAATAFSGKMTKFEQDLIAESEDMVTIAELLEMAAEACATAEDAMTDLIVEIVEALLVAAATAAIVALLTAGVGAALGPLMAAGGTAHRMLKAVRITAKLADRLKDLADRMRALRKLRRLRTKARAAWRHKPTRKKIKTAVKFPVKKAVGAKMVGAAIDAAPTANSVIEHQTGVDVGEKVSGWADSAERTLHETTGLKEVHMGDKTWDVEHQGASQPPPTEEQADYRSRPEPRSFQERSASSVRDVFG
jgi:WXG100 family type VII secretion target